MREHGLLGQTRALRVELFGSLGHTGRGHGTDRALMLGLEGQVPERVDPELVGLRSTEIERSGRLSLAAEQGPHRMCRRRRRIDGAVIVVWTHTPLAPGRVA